MLLLKLKYVYLYFYHKNHLHVNKKSYVSTWPLFIPIIPNTCENVTFYIFYLRIYQRSIKKSPGKCLKSIENTKYFYKKTKVLYRIKENTKLFSQKCRKYRKYQEQTKKKQKIQNYQK